MLKVGVASSAFDFRCQQAVPLPDTPKGPAKPLGSDRTRRAQLAGQLFAEGGRWVEGWRWATHDEPWQHEPAAAVGKCPSDRGGRWHTASRT